MLLRANNEPAIRGRVHPNNTSIVRVALSFGGAVVGFYTPHKSADGRGRIGPVYIEPEHRGRGLVTALYRTLEGPMLAAILDTDVESARAHEQAGFTRWRRFAKGWYWRRG